MSYFSNNKIYDKYILDGIVSPSQSPYIKDIIEIFNNQTFQLDLTNIIFSCSDNTITNQQFTKLRIDWGDGHSDVLSKPLTSKASTISTYDPVSWKSCNHLFNVEKRYEYEEGISAQSLPKIEIILYNTFNDRVKIYIPYKMVYKTIYDIGSKFSLISANVNNRNLVSYVLKQHKDDTMLIVSSGDWERYHGQIVERVHDIKNVSSADYSNQFVNEDSIVWNWKSVPQVQLTINLVGNYFQCKFQERTINVQEWTPRCQKLGYENQEITTEIIDFKNKVFKTEDKLQNGVYKLWLDMVGINQIEGQSQTIYKVIPQKSYTPPAKLQSRNQFVKFDYTNSYGLNYITSPQFDVLYSLGNYQFQVSPNMIKSAKVIFELNSISKVHTDGSNGYQDVIDDVKFEFDLPFSPVNINNYSIQNYNVLDVNQNGLKNDKIVCFNNGIIETSETIETTVIPPSEIIDFGLCDFNRSIGYTEQFSINNKINFETFIDREFINFIWKLKIDNVRIYNVYPINGYIQNDKLIYSFEIAEPSIYINEFNDVGGYEIDEIEFTNNSLTFNDQIVMNDVIYPREIFVFPNQVSTTYQLTNEPIDNIESIIKTEKLVIDTSSIPDGVYSTKILVQDVLGNVQQNIYNDNNVIALPNFTIKYEIGEVQSLTINNDDFDEVSVDWTVEENTQTNEMSIKVNDIINIRQSADNFKVGDKYSYTIPSYKIPDGTLTAKVDNIVNMTSFGGDRRKSSSKTVEFRYDRPNIVITDVTPYISVSNGNITVMSDIEAYETKLRKVDGLKLKYDTTSDQNKKTEKDIANLTNLSWNGSIDKIKNKNLYITGYDSNDMIQKRQSSIDDATPYFVGDLVYNLNDEVKKYSMLKKSSTNEMLKNYSTRYLKVNENKKITLGQVKSQSLIDVNKNYYYENSEGDRFYVYVDDSSKEVPYYEVNNNKKYLAFTTQLYQIGEYKEGQEKNEDVKKYYRFVGKKLKEEDEFNPQELIPLEGVEEYITDGNKKLYEVAYDNENDIGKITFNIREYHDPNDENNEYVDGGIIASYIYITDVNASEVTVSNLIKMIDYTEMKQRPIEVEVPLGDCKIFIQNVNLFVRSDDQRYQSDTISIGVLPSECITFNLAQRLGDSSTTSTFRYNFTWELHHKQITSFKIHVRQYYNDPTEGDQIIVNDETYKTWKFQGNVLVIKNDEIFEYDAAKNELKEYISVKLKIEDAQIKSISDEFEYDVMGLDYYIPLSQFRHTAKHDIWATIESPYINWGDSQRKIVIKQQGTSQTNSN